LQPGPSCYSPAISIKTFQGGGNALRAGSINPLATHCRGRFLARAFEYERITGHFAGRDADAGDELVSITVTPMLEAALAERYFYSTFVVEGLDAIYGTQAEILSCWRYSDRLQLDAPVESGRLDVVEGISDARGKPTDQFVKNVLARVVGW
jgi:hypothetical protein